MPQKTGSMVTFLEIDAQEDSSTVSQFIQGYKGGYPILIDTSAQTVKDYQIRGFPTTMFVDEKGILPKIHTGELYERDLVGNLESIGVTP